MDSKTFVAGLVEEMRRLFARLGEHETLESEAEGRMDVVTLLKLALKSELEASELAGFWMPTTPEVGHMRHAPPHERSPGPHITGWQAPPTSW